MSANAQLSGAYSLNTLAPRARPSPGFRYEGSSWRPAVSRIGPEINE